MGISLKAFDIKVIFGLLKLRSAAYVTLFVPDARLCDLVSI